MNEQDNNTSSTISHQLIEIGIPFTCDESLARTEADPSSREKLINLNGEDIDFIASAHAIKALWSVPLASAEAEISVVIHNVAGTLLVDDSVVHETSSRNGDHFKAHGDLSKVKSIGATSSQSDMILSYLASSQSSEESITFDDSVVSILSPKQIFSPGNMIIDPQSPRQFIPWKFSGLNMIIGSDSIVIPENECTSSSLALWLASSTDLRAQLTDHETVVHSCVSESNEELHATKNTFAFNGQEIGQTNITTTIMSRTFDSQIRKLEYESNLIVGDHRYSHERSSSAVITVLDVYLDTLIANVPELALCLHDKGFIQSIQLLKVHELPHLTTHRLDGFANIANSPPLFSPDVVETNATMLLNFLKYHCSQDHSTYLLRKQAGETTVQLYDLSALSRQRKQQWLWWLAMTSYRFALRLKQFSLGMNKKENLCALRILKTRQRNLLKNALELLEEHVDMGGKEHETITAALNECLADTYLDLYDSEKDDKNDKDISNESIRTKTIVSSFLGISSKVLIPRSAFFLPYRSLKTDSLTKAQDYLIKAIETLKSLLMHSSVESDPSTFFRDDFLSMRLYGLTYKLINVLLQVTVHYLNSYSTSNAMQSVRMIGRRLSDSLHIMQNFDRTNSVRKNECMINLFSQSLSLWEHCGIFARSYFSDGLWRDRGHAGGDDIVCLLQDVQSNMTAVDGFLSDFSRKEVEGTLYDFNLNNLTGIVESTIFIDKKDNVYIAATAIASAKQMLDSQKLIKREELRVIVAATLCFGRAIWILEIIEIFRKRTEATLSKTESFQVSSLAQDSYIRQLYGDACNEVGKLLLAKVKDLLLSPSDVRFTVHEAEGSPSAPHAPLLVSAETWFIKGLAQFQVCNDKKNIAVIRCNLCQCSKLRANTAVALPRIDSCASYQHERFSRDNHSELCLQDAINHLQLAHLALYQRETDSKTWDMVSEELAASYLVLGVKRRQTIIGGATNFAMPKDLRIQPGEERFIIEPMQQAITIYDQLGNQHQAAAAHYQLAIFYSKVWSMQLNEGKMREKLEKAFGHFKHAHGYFFNHIVGNEPTFVILCLDLSQLYSSVSSEVHCLIKALFCCIDTSNAFAPKTTQNEDDWTDKMKTLSKRMDETVFSLLVNLVKLEKVCANSQKSVCFKNIYRNLLALKIGSEIGGSDGFSVYKILLQLKDEMKPFAKDQNFIKQN